MPSLHRRLLIGLLGAASVIALSAFGAPAVEQAPPVDMSGPRQVSRPPPPVTEDERVAILHDLRSLKTTGTVLHVGAHPDDENTNLIAWLSRGRGYRAAYLSLTRGDGGQNELGPEFSEKLGVARTQELLAARKIDGGRQFFTRAIDFGYSKSPEETLAFWDRGEVLGDVVRVIRIFQPDVIVTRFPIPPGSGGHGQHTASGILAVEAFKIAGDPSAYPDQIAAGLKPWQPKRVLWNSWRDPRSSGLDGPVITVDIGGDDPVTAESFASIANESRAMHKTQGLGGFAGRGGGGPNPQTFMLLAGEPAESDLMDGVDTTWSRFSGGEAIGAMVESVIEGFDAANPAASVPALLAIRHQLDALDGTDAVVADRRAIVDRVIQTCLGMKLVVTADRPEVVPGEAVELKTHRVNRAVVPGRFVARRILVNGTVAKEEKADPGAGNVTMPGEQMNRDTVTIPAGTALTQPYWLREEGSEGMARVSDPSLIGLPEAAPELSLEVEYDLGGRRFILSAEPLFVSGGSTEPLRYVPPVSLALDSDVYVFHPGSTETISVTVSAGEATVIGDVRLDAPEGWRVVPQGREFRLDGDRRHGAFGFDVTAPDRSDRGRLKAVAIVDGLEYSNRREEIRYPHIPAQLLQPPAQSGVASFDFEVRARRIGYLPGAGDDVANCLGRMGVEVKELGGADLTPERLAGLDAVVFGVRAFEERDDLAANMPGLLEWVERGGTLVVQYNRPNRLKTDQIGPFPLSIQGNAASLRVTDETAPVKFLAPEHPVLNTPNKITMADFDGWVQERGTYFPSKWDEASYTTILAMSDPGEAQPDSSILVAKYGKGHYVYTGIAFFRQLPAGVPGAYRLFANLISLGK